MALPLARGSDGLLSTRRCVREYREARAAEAASMGVGFTVLVCNTTLGLSSSRFAFRAPNTRTALGLTVLRTNTKGSESRGSARRRRAVPELLSPEAPAARTPRRV